MGWVWGGFGTDFGRIWEGFGKVLGGFEKFWEDLGKVLEAFSQAFLCQDPRAVSRSPAERLNARGSQPPSVLDFLEFRLSQFPPWEGLRPLWRRVRGGRRLFDSPPLGGVLGSFFALFSLFFRILAAS